MEEFLLVLFVLEKYRLSLRKIFVSQLQAVKSQWEDEFNVAEMIMAWWMDALER